jgi:hypothetical protein
MEGVIKHGPADAVKAVIEARKNQGTHLTRGEG